MGRSHWFGWVLILMITNSGYAFGLAAPGREFEKCKVWLNQVCPPLKGRLAAVKCAWLAEPSGIAGCDPMVRDLIGIELSQAETNSVCNTRWRCKSPMYRTKNPSCGSPEVELPCEKSLARHQKLVNALNGQTLQWLERD